MKTKEKIEHYKNSPVEVGDLVSIRGRGLQNKNAWGHSVKVLKVNTDGSIEVESQYRSSEKTEIVAKENYVKNPFYIGVNPFIKKPWNSSLRIVSFPLDSILHSIGFERNNKVFTTETIGDVIVPELNWNPYFINHNGDKIHYQRDFVWSEHDKQLLIESIYNFVDIGKVVVRKRSWQWVEKEVKSGNTEVAFKDIVDGKQRLNAILGFVKDEFTDLNGNYYSDLSGEALSTFKNFQSISYGEIGEDATDEDVKAVFLGVNFTGVPMSQEHIDYVKEIKLG